MKHVIIAVGGTGQLLLTHYCQLFVTGQVNQPFRAIVLDTDRFSRRLSLFQKFFQDARNGGRNPNSIPEILWRPLERDVAAPGNQIKDVFGARELSDGGYQHPVQALLGRGTLVQSAAEGLFSRPCAAAFLLPGTDTMISGADIGSGATVVLAASAVGGTGGGLTVPLLCQVQRIADATQGVRMRAVLLGEYFVPSAGVLDQETLRFQSNKRWLLQSIAYSADRLEHIAWLDPDRNADRLPQRDANNELDGLRVPWCEENKAPWQGTAALEYLLNDSIHDVAPDFAAREIRPEIFSPVFQQRTCLQRLHTAASRANTFVRKQVPTLVAQEALPGRVWGDRLPFLLSRYYRLAQRHRPELTVSSFSAGLCLALRSYWTELQGALPPFDKEHVSVGQISRVSWDPPDSQTPDASFRNDADANRCTAAALLDLILRHGEKS